MSIPLSTTSNPRRVRPGKGTGRWLLFAGILLFLFAPIAAVTLQSIAKGWTTTALPTTYTLDHWAGIVNDPRLRAAILRSLLLSTGVVIIAAALVLPPLYWAHVRNPRIRTVMALVSLVPFTLPFIVIAFGTRELTQLVPIFGDFAVSWQLVLVCHVAICFPFLLWPVDSAMAGTDIKRLHEAAQTSGATPLRTMFSVVVPSVRTGLVTGGVLAFAVSFGEFSIPWLITRASFETVPVWQMTLQSPEGGGGNPGGVAVMAVVTFILFFAVALFAALSRGGDQAQGSVLPGVQTKGNR